MLREEQREDALAFTDDGGISVLLRVPFGATRMRTQSRAESFSRTRTHERK
jgi:hypothetical protein